jgi:DNA-binding response OmpR family regulator
MRILLIEDEPSHAKLALAVLTSAGDSVRHVAAAHAAIEAVATEQPDAILLDLKLPDIDGLELVRRLRRGAVSPGLTIVACTAYTDMFSEQAARAAGCDDFLVKPLDTRILSARIRASIKKTP